MQHPDNVHVSEHIYKFVSCFLLVHKSKTPPAIPRRLAYDLHHSLPCICRTISLL